MLHMQLKDELTLTLATFEKPEQKLDKAHMLLIVELRGLIDYAGSARLLISHTKKRLEKFPYQFMSFLPWNQEHDIRRQIEGVLKNHNHTLLELLADENEGIHEQNGQLKKQIKILKKIIDAETDGVMSKANEMQKRITDLEETLNREMKKNKTLVIENKTLQDNIGIITHENITLKEDLSESKRKEKEITKLYVAKLDEVSRLQKELADLKEKYERKTDEKKTSGKAENFRFQRA